ncbi:hypothetical protein [Micromonospora orduensis]|uniref:hypothetical protein n=1 Tax=Micromonospora orduensis TaxID=1420891 RepID=UPI00142EBA23|nr:hypothetical protein [Micromonospora orduensis]
MTDTRPVLLVLDYPGRREEARIADLRLQERGYDVRHLLVAPFSRELDAPSYARDLVRRHRLAEASVAAVLSYCMSAAIAQEVAALVNRDQEPVRVVLFDAEPVTPAAVAGQYAEALRQMAEQLDVGQPQPWSGQIFDEDALTRRPDEVIRRMRQELVGFATSALTAGSYDEDEAAGTASALAELYLDWLVHLVAAYHATWPAWGGSVVHVLSRSPGFTGPWPGARETHLVRTAAPRADLLSTAEVAAMVDAHLRQVPTSVTRSGERA